MGNSTNLVFSVIFSIKYLSLACLLAIIFPYVFSLVRNNFSIKIIKEDTFKNVAKKNK